MAIRTYKFRGGAFAPTGNVSVIAVFNGAEIHNGPVPTIQDVAPAQHSDMNDLWQMEMDTSVTGNINLSIEVQGGTLWFGGVWTNYCGTDPGNVAANIPPTPPQDFWGSPYPVDSASDGKINCAINGLPEYPRVVDPDVQGEWQYPITSGSTFTCSINIDPALIVTQV